MKNVKVLDCTLRDGGRCFGNMWGDEVIYALSQGLAKAKVDIIEIGFLWYLADGICRENISHFRKFNEITPFLEKGQEYAVYIEYAVYKRNKRFIPSVEETGIAYIRLGVTREEVFDAIETMQDIISKGYKLFVQGINIFAFSEHELEEFIDVVNSIQPYAFAIVDTFGHMNITDLDSIYMNIDGTLNSNISIALHCHDNKGISLELAKYLIDIANEKRQIIIDGTLLGIGMGAGNQSTEKVCTFLNAARGTSYNLIEFDKMIDRYIKQYMEKFYWGHCNLSQWASDYFRPPMMISYINTEYDCLSEFEKRLLMLLCPIQHGAEYEMVDKNARCVCTDKTLDFAVLSKEFFKENINIVAKGNSTRQKILQIKQAIKENSGITILINPEFNSEYIEDGEKIFLFFITEESLNNFCKLNKCFNVKQIITFRGLCKKDTAVWQVNIADLYNEDEMFFFDGVMLILNWLYKIGTKKKINIAGFDGYDNMGITGGLKTKFYSNALDRFNGKLDINYVTETIYEQKRD